MWSVLPHVFGSCRLMVQIYFIVQWRLWMLLDSSGHRQLETFPPCGSHFISMSTTCRNRLCSFVCFFFRAFLYLRDVSIFQNPRDIAYTYSGYAPLSIRLAQHAARPSGWRGVEEVWHKLYIVWLEGRIFYHALWTPVKNRTTSCPLSCVFIVWKPNCLNHNLHERKVLGGVFVDMVFYYCQSMQLYPSINLGHYLKQIN